MEGENKPDIIVSGASGVVEIALEVKPADSYSPNELKHALDWQLAETYLKSTTRRHGVLVLFDFGRRKWRNPDTGKALTFDDLLDLLSQHATKVKRNSTGDVLVSIFGLSAVDS